MMKVELFPITIPTNREYITVVGAIRVSICGLVHFKYVLHNKTNTEGFVKLLAHLREDVFTLQTITVVADGHKAHKSEETVRYA